MKSLGTFQVQNKMFNLHIIQVMYKIRELGSGDGGRDLNKSWNTEIHLCMGKWERTLQIPNMFCAINSLRTKWPHLIPHKCQTLLEYHYKYLKKKKKGKQGSNYRTASVNRDEVHVHCMYCRQGRGIFFFLKLLHRLHIILKKYAGLYKI